MLTRSIAFFRPSGSVITPEHILPKTVFMYSVLPERREELVRFCFVFSLESVNAVPSQDASSPPIRIVSFRFVLSPVKAGIKIMGNAIDTPKSNSKKFLTVTAIA